MIQTYLFGIVGNIGNRQYNKKMNNKNKFKETTKMGQASSVSLIDVTYCLKEGVKENLSDFKNRERTTKSVLGVSTPLDKVKGKFEAGVKDETDGKWLDTGKSLHALVQTLEICFNEERPVSLRPDDFLLPIIQSTATWINQHAEQVRSKFVSHDGKLELVVKCDGFRIGNPDNNWPVVFKNFAGQIRSHIGNELYEILRGSFTTTGPTQATTYDLTLMDAMKSYFSYFSASCCGIPTIQLLGTTDDWLRLRELAIDVIALTGEKEYLNEMKVILDKIVGSVTGSLSPLEKAEFWSNIYRFEGGSGFCGVDGWINMFFPYDSKNVRLTIKQMRSGLSEWQSCRNNNDFPSSISSMPMVWNEHGNLHNCRLYSGQMGVVQRTDNKFIMPGWAWGLFIE